ncbi:MAG: heme-binding protein [Phycisphaerales bacterium JB059]
MPTPCVHLALPLLLLNCPTPPIATDAPQEPAPQVVRVEGDPDALRVIRDGERYRAGDSFTEAALPEGYPAPTHPEAVEIKTYPPVRRAQVSGPRGSNPSPARGFFPLFNHIKKHDIAMTAPVEMILAGEGLPQPEGDALDTHTNEQGQGWTMSFLYRTPDLGPTGTDAGVEIIDAQAVTVLALGVRGRLDEAATQAGLTRLMAWIESDGRFEIAGHARTLGYNGPYVPRDLQWWEIQIPLRPIEAESGDPTGD